MDTRHRQQIDVMSHVFPSSYYGCSSPRVPGLRQTSGPLQAMALGTSEPKGYVGYASQAAPVIPPFKTSCAVRGGRATKSSFVAMFN